MTKISVTSKENSATSSKKNSNNLKIPTSYYQIGKSDSAAAEIGGIIKAYTGISFSYYKSKESDHPYAEIIRQY